MPLHLLLQEFVDAGAQLPPMESFTPQQVRAGDDARFAAIPRPAVAHVEDRTVPGPRGHIRIRIYRPDGESGHPIIAFFHGSGFCICSLDTHDGLCKAYLVEFSYSGGRMHLKTFKEMPHVAP